MTLIVHYSIFPYTAMLTRFASSIVAHAPYMCMYACMYVCMCIDTADRSRIEFLKKLGTWTFTSAEELERSENRIRDFVSCKTRQEFVTTQLRNPGVEDVEISINTVSCGDYAEDKPTLGT